MDKEQRKWNYYGEKNREIFLLVPSELDAIPDGTVLFSIDGQVHMKGREILDKDTRFGLTAYGLQSEDFDKLIGKKKPFKFRSNIWPVTVIATRYQGTYEGGVWAAFKARPWEVDQDAMGSDITCFDWWDAHRHEVGLGATPMEAILDLEEKQGRQGEEL